MRVIIFDRLGDEDLDRIVGLQIGTGPAAAGAKKLDLQVSPAARRRIAREGYDPVFGARPLKRAIQRELLDPLSLQLLEGKFAEAARSPPTKKTVVSCSGEPQTLYVMASFSPMRRCSVWRSVSSDLCVFFRGIFAQVGFQVTQQRCFFFGRLVHFFATAPRVRARTVSSPEDPVFDGAGAGLGGEEKSVS